MSGKLPIDRVREARKAPRIFVEHSERLAQQEAELRDADDPVAGARPRASDVVADSADEPVGADEPEHA
jgi:hypothetical protein